MKFNTKTRYALRTMIEIAMDSDQNGILQKEIAKNQEISEKYLDQIIASLKIAGLIKNLKGKKSGYILGKDSSVIKVKNIIEAFEADFVLKENNHYDENKSIAAEIFWKGLVEKMLNYADSITLKELAEIEKQSKLKENKMYYI